jgi:hypothetical protein
MALGYEGYVKVGGEYALGTGGSVPRARARLDSSSGYGGNQGVGPQGELGIGAPRTYDWDRWEGTLNFDLSRDFWKDLMFPWIFVRQTAKEVIVVSRYGNEQKFTNAFWSSISVSGSDGAGMEGSIGFTAIERTNYAYGTQGLQGLVVGKQGVGLLCVGSQGFPAPLNADRNLSPIPFWNTKVKIDGAFYDFTNWTLNFAQDVVLFFASTDAASGVDPGPKAPDFLAVGPMTVTFSGDYMLKASSADGGTGAEIDGELTLADQTFKINSMELQSISDDLQTGDSLVPLSVEYAVYDIDQA